MTLRDVYATADRRALALVRIALSLVLLADLFRRAHFLTLFFSNDGVLSNHFLLFAPQARPQVSLLFACSTPGQAAFFFGLFGLVYALLLVGFHTRVAAAASFFALISLNNRNLMFEDRGSVMLAGLVTFGMFLPWGDRFSIDAVLAQFRASNAPGEPSPPTRGTPSFTGVAVLALTLSFVLYGSLSLLSRQGAAWSEGTAVHFLMWQHRFATPVSVWLRMHEPAWFSPMATWVVLVAHATVVLLVALPLGKHRARARSLAIMLVFATQLVASLFLDFGMLPFAVIAASLLFAPTDILDAIHCRIRRGRRRIIVVYDPRHRGMTLLARSLQTVDALQLLVFVRREGARSFATKVGRQWHEGDDACFAAIRAMFAGRLLASPLRIFLSRAVEELLQLAGDGRPFSVPQAGSGSLVTRAGRIARESLASVFLASMLVTTIATHDIFRRVHLTIPALLAPFASIPRLVPEGALLALDARSFDDTLVIDVELADGLHLDPFTGRTPDFDAARIAGDSPPRAVATYLSAMRSETNAPYRRDLAHWLEMRQERDHLPPNERIVGYRAHSISYDSPVPGAVEPSEARRTLLFSSEE